MKSFFKKFLALAVVCVSIASLMALTACGGSGGSGYTFEAEYCCADDWEGGGYSGSAMGTGLIKKDENNAGASNGNYLTYTWSPNLTVNFEITSSEDTTAKLALRLGNELKQAVEMNPENFAVKVNGVALNYTAFTLKASKSDGYVATGFDDYAVGDVSLKAGANTIALIVGDCTPDGEHKFGPCIDAIKLDTSANLTMLEYKENVAE